MTESEIAAALGVRVETVARLVARGLTTLDALAAEVAAAHQPAARANDENTPEPGHPPGGWVVLEVPMNYPGKVISVGHCYRHVGNKKYLHREARQWRAALEQSLRMLALGEGLGSGGIAPPVTVRIDCAYRNEREATDPDNLMKLTWDATKRALGVDDRHFQPATGTVAYGALIPSLTITVTVARGPAIATATDRAAVSSRAPARRRAAP